MPILESRARPGPSRRGGQRLERVLVLQRVRPGSDSGFFTRVGVRPNEGTMDVGMSVWLPGGELGEYRWLKEQQTMVDTALEVGGVRYDMLEPARSGASHDGTVPARPCVRGGDAASGRGRPRRAIRRRHAGYRHRRPAERWAEVGRGRRRIGTVGKGHLEQAGRWTGTLEVDGVAYEWHGAHGNRDRSWGPRRWGGPKMWRWFSINVGRADALRGHPPGHRGRRPAPGLGLGRHTGHVGGRMAGADRAGRRRGDAPGGPPRRGRQGGAPPTTCAATSCGWPTSAGPAAPWSTRDWPVGPTTTPTAPARTGFGICEYLHQLDEAGRPVVPVE